MLKLENAGVIIFICFLLFKANTDKFPDLFSNLKQKHNNTEINAPLESYIMHITTQN